jgi:hypothetical protein
MNSCRIISGLIFLFFGALSSGHPEDFWDYWKITTLDEVGDVGLGSHIAMVPQSGPAISYLDVTNYALKFAWLQDGTWRKTVVVPEGVYGFSTKSAVLPGSGRCAIAYLVYSSVSGRGLGYAWQTDSGWNHTTVLSGIYPLNFALVVRPFDHPAIAYYDYYTKRLRYAELVGDNPSDPTDWDHTTIDDIGNSGHGCEMVLMPDSQPAVCYSDLADLRNVKLKYARRDSEGVWHKETIITQGDFYTPVGSPLIVNSLAVSKMGLPMIVYESRQMSGIPGKLYVANFNGTTWIQTLLPNSLSCQYSDINFLPSGSPAVAYNAQGLGWTWQEGSAWKHVTLGDAWNEPTSMTWVPLDSGEPAIAYYFQGTVSNLKYATPNVCPVPYDLQYSCTAQTDWGGSTIVQNGPASNKFSAYVSSQVSLEKTRNQNIRGLIKLSGQDFFDPISTTARVITRIHGAHTIAGIRPRYRDTVT